MSRSYYTTPLFVLTTLVSLFVFVEYHNTQQFILNTANKTFIDSQSVFIKIRQQIHNIDSRNKQVHHMPMPDSVRSIYISSWVAGTPSLRDKLVDFIETSDVNSVIIDIKDSTGVISFPFDHPWVQKYSTDSRRITDIEDFIQTLHEKDIYVIGRLTAFQDPLLSKVRPDLSFKRIDNGEVWADRKGLAFLNPKNTEAWEYLGDIAEYSYQIGFDEINFDYIRYPSDGNLSNINYELTANESRPQVMKSFYGYLDNRLRSKKIPISADIFGLVTTSKNDIGIGQIFEDIYPHFDAIAPMVYPSHYGPGFFGYDNPNAHPYAVIEQSMTSAINRAENINEDPDKLRPWIQDFNLGSPRYGVAEVNAQIQATFDIGLDSYMSWDPKNRYTQKAYQ